MNNIKFLIYLAILDKVREDTHSKRRNFRPFSEKMWQSIAAITCCICKQLLTKFDYDFAHTQMIESG